jgi:UvrB/uvrC motif
MQQNARDPQDHDVDISAALKGWSFQPGQVNVRKIRGRDGKPKIQLRLDLGLLQMETTGRPDGRRPHNSRTELDYQLRRLKNYQTAHNSEQGFQLTEKNCKALREEASMFYHRYLSLFVLGDYEGVVRDAQHNLGVLNICRKFGHSERDREILEQYRPYILMMDGRARACIALRDGFVKTAIAFLRGTLRLIISAYGDPRARQSPEARVILEMIRDIRRQLPPDPKEELHRLLKKALKRESYEEAAALRDRIMALHTTGALPEPQPVAHGAPRRRRAASSRKAIKPHSPQPESDSDGA